MIAEPELTQLLKVLEYLPTTQEAIRQIIALSPTKRPQGQRGNISGFYASRKMGFRVPFSSLGELALIYHLEHDDDFLGYYAYPPKIRLCYAGPTSKATVAHHTPDFFVVARRECYWVECKDEDELPKLKDEKPNRYRFVDGEWMCPPGREHARPLGLDYRLHSSADISAYFVRNVRFLDDYFRSDLPVSKAAAEQVSECLIGGTIRLSNLYDQLEGRVTRDEIHFLIAREQIHIDWDEAPLAEQPENVHVFAELEDMEAFRNSRVSYPVERGVLEVRPGIKILRDGVPCEVRAVGCKTITLALVDGTEIEIGDDTIGAEIRDGRIAHAPGSEQVEVHPEVQKRIQEASKKDLAEATHRLRIIRAHLRGEPRPPGIPDRTLRRWEAAFRTAEEAYGNGFVGLIPRLSKRGNRKCRYSDEVCSATDDHIARVYEKGQASSVAHSYRMFRDERITKNFPVPSEEFYAKTVKCRDIEEQAQIREGKRKAYKYRKWNLASGKRVPPHGDRAWEKAHIDHTRIDLETPYGENGEYTNRMWLTTMTDAYTRKYLALSLNPDPPSHRSCMLVIRDCVRRHGRLPQTIISDHGKEFESEFYETLLAYYEVEQQLRPVGQPRFGSTHERLFGTANTHFIHNLRGATQLMKNVRMVTKSHNPKRLAVWTFKSLEPFLEEYLFGVSNNLVRSAHGCSPDEAFEESLAATGRRSFVGIRYDTTFLMMSSPTTEKGTAKVVAGRGVIVNYFAYRCAELDEPRVQNTRVQVRFDPYDVGSAWVLIAGRWRECHSEFHAEFKGRTLKQIELAAKAIRKNHRNFTNARLEINGALLAEFFSRVKDHDDILVQEARDKAAAESRAALSPNKSTSEEGSHNHDKAASRAGRTRLKIGKKTITSAEAAPAKRVAV